MSGGQSPNDKKIAALVVASSERQKGGQHETHKWRKTQWSGIQIMVTPKGREIFKLLFEK